jgi:hypothetical protein
MNINGVSLTKEIWDKLPEAQRQELKYVQVEDGIEGYFKGWVLKNENGQPMCAFCGYCFDDLIPHIAAAHRMTGRTYREQVGLDPLTDLSKVAA